MTVWSGNEFVFSSCDFVDRYACPEKKDDPRSHTKQHEPKYFRLELDDVGAKSIDSSLLSDSTMITRERREKGR